MNARLQAFIETHPWAAPIAAVLAWLVDAGLWCIRHSETFTRVFVLLTAVLGFAVMWYSFRIKRREWQRGERKRRPALDPFTLRE